VISLSEMRSYAEAAAARNAAATRDQDVANGIRRASERVIRLHPTWDDQQIARSLGLRHDEISLVGETRQAMEQDRRKAGKS
jgi:hypothetical protein